MAVRLTPCVFASRTASAQSGCGIRLARLPLLPPRLKPAPPPHQIGRQLPTLRSRPSRSSKTRTATLADQPKRIQAALPEEVNHKIWVVVTCRWPTFP